MSNVHRSTIVAALILVGCAGSEPPEHPDADPDTSKALDPTCGDRWVNYPRAQLTSFIPDVRDNLGLALDGTSDPQSIEQIYTYARDTLRATHLTWTRVPAYRPQLLSYLQTHAAPLNARRPARW